MLRTLVVLTALTWLVSRLFKFLSIPVDNMVHALNIKTPPSTKVSIDKISNTSITIHWENEPVQDEQEQEFKKDSITQYIVYVNNLQMGVFPNCPHSLYTCCSITNLNPTTQYQLDFITVNNMGFISKLPSIFVMTKTEQKSDNKDIIKNRKWRRNTVSSPNANSIVSGNDNTTATTTTNNNNTAAVIGLQDDVTPSYANLTNIKDLETYTIDDLKKILICAQEDLHDVLAQQTSYLQDFKESKEELNLELDNLKSHWSHELDFRKSLKSNIKSLENNKLLSDMKAEKLTQKIVKSNDKLIRMKSDIAKWSEIEKKDLNRDILDDKYSKMNAKLNESIKELEDKISSVQNETGKLEKENKELSFMKKSSSSTNLSTLANNINNSINNNTNNNNTPKVHAPTDEASRLASIIRKANSFIAKDTGLLSQQGEEYLATLNDDNQLVKLIKEQLTIDVQNHEYWNKKKQDLSTTIKNLENRLDNMDKQNRQLRAKILAQPYSNEMNDNQNQQPLHFIPSEMSSFSGSNSKSFVNLTNLNSNQNNGSNPQLQSSQPLLQQQQQLQQQQSNYIAPSISKQSSLLQSQLTSHHMANDEVNQTLSSFPVNMSTTTTTAMANVNASAHNQLSPPPTYSNWSMPTTTSSNVEPQEQIPQKPKADDDDLDQPFDYDNANHLITGLQDMIYDETDYPEKISNYSKGFTTDQLDNYWTSQRGNNNNATSVDPIKINTTEDGKPYPTFTSEYNMQTPMTSHTREFGTPLSKSPFIMPPSQPAQSLLAATLNDQTMSPFGNDSLSLRHNDSAGFYRQPPNHMGQQTNSNNLTSVFSNTNSANAFSQSLTPHNSNILSSTPQAIPFPKEPIAMSDGYHHSMIYGSSQQDHIQPTVIKEEERDIREHSKSPSDGLFQSPSFNFLWHNNSPTKHGNSNEHLTSQNDKKKGTSSNGQTSPSHKRNKSDGSSMSTWTNRLSLRSKAASTSSQESSLNVTSERDDTSTEKEESTNQASTSSMGSGRKMSRLLSRSTVNDIFKLRNHDSHS